jgi:hypothetical protein
MLITAAVAAHAVPPSEWLYILAAIATLVGTVLVIRSAWKKYIKQRQGEAVEKAELSKAILGNMEATRENTAALGKLGADFHDFALETRSQLNGHAERLGYLEHPAK